MKTQIRRRILLLAASCALAAIVFPGTASSTVISQAVTAGRPNFAADYSCWQVTWTGLVNTCALGSATKKLLVPVNAATWDSWHGSAVEAYGQYQQTGGAWVSCIGVTYAALTGTYYVTNRKTTSNSTAQVEYLDLGPLSIATNEAQYFDCDVTYGGAVYYTEHW
jgi:hypothetical protein